MTRGLRHERFVEHEIGLLQAVVDIAERPLVAELAERQLALPIVGESLFRPFPDGDLRRRRTRRRRAAATSGVARCAAATRWRRRAYPDVALRDRKSTRLNSSHRTTSYAVVCLKK